MSQPTVVSVSPSANQSGVILGSPVVITFDQAIDTSTLTSATFSLSGPGTTTVFAPSSLVYNQAGASPTQGLDLVGGTFTFATDSQSRTVATFTPASPLRPSVTYSALLAGADSLSGQAIKNPGGETIATNYSWSFTTGTLNLTTPPVSSPIAFTAQLLPESIQVIPLLGSDVSVPAPYSNGAGGAVGIAAAASVVYQPGNGYSQGGGDSNTLTGVKLVFPAAVDPNSFSVDSILVALQPMLGDYAVAYPGAPTPTVTVAGNTITISFTGWTD